MLLTSRPSDGDDEWPRFVSDPDRCTRLTLGALAIVDIQAMAAQAGVELSRVHADRLHRHTLGHPLHDPFWQRLHDSGITVCIHSGDAGYGFMLDYWGQDSEFEAFRYSPLRSLLTTSPISDAVASFIAEGIFTRFPNIRLATIESGSEWVGPLFKKLKKAYGQHQHAFAEDPRETFRKHVWVSPYYEDDLLELREMIGAEHILFGSDWPHAEGLADPVSFIHDLKGFSDDEIRLIMRDNAFGLVTPKTALANA